MGVIAKGNRHELTDSTTVGTHQQATCGKGGQGQVPDRSRGGLSTEVQPVAEAQGRLERFFLGSGQRVDVRQTRPLLTDAQTERSSLP